MYITGFSSTNSCFYYKYYKFVRDIEYWKHLVTNVTEHERKYVFEHRLLKTVDKDGIM